MTGGRGPRSARPISGSGCSSARPCENWPRTTRRADGHGADAAGPGDVRARRAAASAPGPVPRVPRTERHLRRNLRGKLWLGGARGGDLGLGGRVQPAPPVMPKLIYIRESDRRDDRLSELLDGSATTTGHTSRSTTPTSRASGGRATSPRSLPNDSTSRAPGLRVRMAERGIPHRARSRTVHDPIGREREVAAVRELLQRGDERVVTLVGPGGIGKSRLAIEVAHATEDLFPDGTSSSPGGRARGRACCCPRSRTSSAFVTTARRRSRSASRTPWRGGAC